ncbi:MAG: HEPN domain-containing protein [Nitrospirae bacterium]|nr:HEPN domain-containing protein [Nitrospirota bacterium]
MACFHAQQCVEKYLKGFLVLHRITFPKTHDLEHLLSEAVEKDPLMEVLRRDTAALKPYSVEIRYPGEEASPAEARTAAQRMKRVRGFLRKKLGLSGDPVRRKRK